MGASDARIQRLEEEVYFLEAEVKGLEQQVIQQQSQLATMARELALVQQRLQEVMVLLAGGAVPTNGVPPHHVPGLW